MMQIIYKELNVFQPNLNYNKYRNNYNNFIKFYFIFNLYAIM